MLDPFPFAAPPLLSLVSQKIANYTSLRTLNLHIHEYLGAALFYHSICLYISPYLSAKFFPRSYAQLSARTKLNWNVHVVSLVQSIVINALALWVIWVDEERWAMDMRERIWGYTGAGGLVQAFAGGYFVWDLWVSTVHIDLFGWGPLAHAVSALYVFSLGYRPFVNYYGPIFILYELSSPFLNFHWFFDKLHMTGSTAQLINGLLLMLSFFGSRLVWGPYQNINAFSDIFAAMRYQNTVEGKAWLKTPISPSSALSMGDSGKAAREMWRFQPEPIPMWLAASYLISSTILTVLNVYWFGKMVETIRKRFPPPFGTMSDKDAKRDLPDAQEVSAKRSVGETGSKSVDVTQKEVRYRGVASKVANVPIPPPH